MAVVSAMISFDFSKTVEHISKLSSFAFLWGRPWHAAAVFYEWAKKDSLGLISWVGVAFSNSGNSGQKDAWSFPLYNNFNVFSKNSLNAGIQDVSTSISIVHDLIEKHKFSKGRMMMMMKVTNIYKHEIVDTRA